MTTSRESSARRERTKLLAKELAFIDEYLRTFNALQSAKTVGYSDRDPSCGDRLVKRPLIAREIARRCLERRERLEVTADHIDQAFAAIAFDPRDEKGGGPNYDQRMTALREMGKLRGLYIQKHVFTGATLEQLLSLAGEREKALPPASPPLRLLQGGKS